MQIFNHKVRKKHRIQYYWWMRVVVIIFGFLALAQSETWEQAIAISFSFAAIVGFLTMAIDTLTWQKGWRKYNRKRERTPDQLSNKVGWWAAPDYDKKTGKWPNRFNK